jgi:hypothetical protein
MLDRSILCIALLSGCSHESAGPRPQETTDDKKTRDDKKTTDDTRMTDAIKTADAAREAAAKRFNALFVPLQIRNPLDQSYYPIAPLSADDFKLVTETDDAFTVAHEPLAGPLVRATVGKATGLVQFEPLELSVE